jgi:hypothetical protein
LRQTLNTLKPDFFEQEILSAYDQRLDKKALEQEHYIEMQQSMLDLISNSRHVSRGKKRPPPNSV